MSDAAIKAMDPYLVTELPKIGATRMIGNLQEFWTGSKWVPIRYIDKAPSFQNDHFVTSGGFGGSKAQSFPGGGGMSGSQNSHCFAGGSGSAGIAGNGGTVIVDKVASDADSQRALEQYLFFQSQLIQDTLAAQGFQGLGSIPFPVSPTPVEVPNGNVPDKESDCIAPELMSKRLRDW